MLCIRAEVKLSTVPGGDPLDESSCAVLQGNMRRNYNRDSKLNFFSTIFSTINSSQISNVGLYELKISATSTSTLQDEENVKKCINRFFVIFWEELKFLPMKCNERKYLTGAERNVLLWFRHGLIACLINV